MSLGGAGVQPILMKVTKKTKAMDGVNDSLALAEGTVVTFLALANNPAWTRVCTGDGREGVVASKRIEPHVEPHVETMPDPDSDDSDDAQDSDDGVLGGAGAAAAHGSGGDVDSVADSSGDDDAEEPPLEDVEKAIEILYAPDVEGYARAFDRPFTIDEVVAELDYEYTEDAVCTALGRICRGAGVEGRQPVCEMRDEGGSNEYYITMLTYAGAD